MPPALIVAGLTAAATVGGALISSSAEGKAADAQVASAERGITEQKRQFDITQENMAPWLRTGQEALETYSGLMGADGKAPDTAAMTAALKKYPGYQFALSEGTEAVEKSAAARGGLTSGQTMKDLTKYGQGLATTNFENYMSRLQGLSGMGQQTAAQVGSFGANMANQVSRSAMQAGQAQATSYQNKATAWGGAIESVAGLAGNYVGGRTNTPDSLSSEALGGGVYS